MMPTSEKLSTGAPSGRTILHERFRDATAIEVLLAATTLGGMRKTKMRGKFIGVLSRCAQQALRHRPRRAARLPQVCCPDNSSASSTSSTRTGHTGRSRVNEIEK